MNEDSLITQCPLGLSGIIAKCLTLKRLDGYTVFWLDIRYTLDQMKTE